MTERYSYTTKGRTVTFTDGKGSDYVYSFDDFGRLVSERNRIDRTQNYTYNENAELKAKNDFEGNVTAVSYDTKTRTKRTQYADGTESVIVYDECGNILSATNESGTLSYAYDKAGMLIKETDGKTGETVSYFYDKAGRRTRLVSRERDISYGYGKNSELLTQKDRLKQLEVHYKYDVCGRETERRFGNGIVQKTRYDKAGRTVSIAQYTGSGNLISGEAYVYDNVGRRSHTVNEKGLVTIYKYDNQSRLETVYYPFNEDIKETARKEADKQGLYFQPSQGNPENYFLSSAELMQLRGVAENFARLRGNAITTNQVVWKESYTYDANGNRTSKTTAWGTVECSYDKENRLIESGELGKSESVKYTYDANGNLLRESAARYRKDYVYNAQNRMSFSDVQDSVLNTRNFTEYAYDAFGRRIETKEYLGDYTRNLYDGFSFDVLGKSILQSAYSANVPVQKYRDGQSRQLSHPELVSGSTSNGRNERGTEIGTRYRYIDDNPLVPLSDVDTSSAISNSASKTRSRPNNEYVLYSYGEPVAMTSDSGASYFGTDILGSIRNVTDKYGAVQADYSYDAFGNPYLGNLENDIAFGYCGKVYDIGTGLYDYGFRDYSPVSARFTTVDPIRDGSNWFSYVVNDPLNYVDYLGLEPDVKQNVVNKKDFINSFSENFQSDIYYQTDYYLLIRRENENNNFESEKEIQKHFYNVYAGKKLSDLYSNTPSDGGIFPDGSGYKSWPGSRGTVTEKNGNFNINFSFGTKIINSICNVGKFIYNLFVSEGNKSEYYKYYTAEEVQNGKLKGWYDEIKNIEPLYFEQKPSAKTEEKKATQEGCTK